ncbi:MAG: methyltransferase domain-containing protein [Chloroflexota bacterium]
MLRTVPPASIDRLTAELTVVDVGAADVNGSYRPLFVDPRVTYVGCDLSAGPGVDVVLQNPYKIPLPDQCADAVISGQMLEHCEYFWLTFAEMMRLLKPDGFLFLIAPSAGPVHQFPVDCYRFYPDSFRALARLADCQLVDLWLDDRGPWNDLVGVFRPAGACPVDDSQAADSLATAAYRAWLTKSHYVAWTEDGLPEAEITAGSQDLPALMSSIHDALSPPLYVEIGVRHGHSLALARETAIGVDPLPEIAVTLSPSVRLFEQTSDQFFEKSSAQALSCGIDLALIDGLHLFESTLRDFMNVENFANPGALVVVDDIFPNHPLQASRMRQTRVWTGDVWKLVHCLQTYRPDLLILPLDTHPAGAMLVAGLARSNRALRDAYNPIVRELASLPADPPPAVTAREHALSPGDARVISLIRLLRECRGSGDSVTAVQSRLRNWRARNGL